MSTSGLPTLFQHHQPEPNVQDSCSEGRTWLAALTRGLGVARWLLGPDGCWLQPLGAHGCSRVQSLGANGRWLDALGADGGGLDALGTDGGGLDALDMPGVRGVDCHQLHGVQVHRGGHSHAGLCCDGRVGSLG